MPRPIIAKIILSAFEHNLSIIKQCSKKTKVFAVLKANAYGHGIKNIYTALSNADGIAVLDINEAIILRNLGWAKPILLLEGIFDITDVEVIHEYYLDIVVHNLHQINLINAWHKQHNNTITQQSKINIFLKANTGMNRLGIPVHHYANIYSLLTQQKWVGNITHMTHYATADYQDENNATKNQFNLFMQQRDTFLNILNTLNVDEKDIIHKSTCNSAGILWHNDMHHDWVRAGIALYGASPTGQHQHIQHLNLKACMHLHSQIIAVQSLKAGACVGYGGTFIAPHDMRIGIVACGYADGYPRQAPNETPVSVLGIKTRLVGRVSMDMITVDITHIHDATIGSHVELWGEHIKIDDVAHISNTIGYELMCAINQRVPIEIVR